MFARVSARPGRPFVLALLGVAGAIGSAQAIVPTRFFDPPPTVTPPKGVEPLPPIIVEVPPQPPEVVPPVRNTPEPGTLVLGAVGAAIAGFVSRRKKK